MRFCVPRFLGATRGILQPRLRCDVPLYVTLQAKRLSCFNYSFPERNLPAGGVVRIGFSFTVILACGILAGDVVLPGGPGHPKPVPAAVSKGKKPRVAAATRKFGERADALLAAAPANKGEWGLLIADAETGEMLYELNADKYFVPASNMKLFTTALALAKLGPDYQFHTTLETRGTVSPAGVLAGDLILVGRGDPNLSNRKFPYNLKEEFDGAPEKVLAELADVLVAKGVKEVSGDVVGDDSYFPREPYPNGWEIDDMVWEYGSAVSAIVVGDNTVKLVNKISQNLHTEMLLRAAARNTAVWNTPDDLMKFPADFYTAAGIAAGDVIQTDGSGLSRHDLVTPRAIVALLKYAQGQPWFAPYFASLPVAGVDGTLETLMKNTASAGRMHAKTGSVEHVRTRSGLADTPGES